MHPGGDAVADAESADSGAAVDGRRGCSSESASSC